MSPLRIKITEIATIGGQVRVRCEPRGGPLPAVRPGQFCLASLEKAALLREPLFPASPTEFVVDESHPWAALEPGAVLDLLGPCGAGWALPTGASRLLIVAENPARVLAVMRAALAQNASVVWAWREAIPDWAAMLLPAEVEFHIGALSAEVAEWAEIALLDVPEPGATAARLRDLRPLRPAGFVQAFCVPLMPCGVGACQACWVATAHGKRLACVDGPIVAI
jgi:dihydroorotate dehydrogenase electron transfer subunit